MGGDILIGLSDELYATMIRRDTKFDGKLYVAIITTGIVCFPSCRSRLPKRENVRVYGTVADALSAGFRPCKRCKPDSEMLRSPNSEIVRQVSNIIETRYQERLTLQVFANELAISSYHLHRIFKRATGYSPAKELERVRLEAAKLLLHESMCSVGDIAKSVGFRTASHFAYIFHEVEGLTPIEYRKISSRQGEF